MDPSRIEVRKNIMLTANINNTSSFTATITGVNFIPDEVNIKGINYHPVAAETGITSLYTDMVTDSIGSFFQDFFVTSGMTYTLRKPISGVYNFLILDYAGALTVRTGKIFIHLEFVRYKKDLPDMKVL